MIIILSFLSGKEIVKILRIGLIMSIFTGVILIPAFLYGNVSNSIMILLKVFASVCWVNMLTVSTRWSDITAAMKGFFVPDIFILVLDLTIKYIVLLGEFSLNMFFALKLRSIGKNNNKRASLSGIAGTMFIKSKEMAEDMYSAMECRGYTGEYKVKKTHSLSWRDVVCIIFNIGILVLYLYL